VSLSAFLERNDVKEYLRLNVPKPWFEVRAEIKAPPLASVPGWCGCAFDSLLRFYVQKLLINTEVSAACDACGFAMPP
jgi:hypothetical protein